jgi:hypothetical protein
MAAASAKKVAKMKKGEMKSRMAWRRHGGAAVSGHGAYQHRRKSATAILAAWHIINTYGTIMASESGISGSVINGSAGHHSAWQLRNIFVAATSWRISASA